jgi:hypothetical protein
MQASIVSLSEDFESAADKVENELKNVTTA